MWTAFCVAEVVRKRLAFKIAGVGSERDGEREVALTFGSKEHAEFWCLVFASVADLEDAASATLVNSYPQVPSVVFDKIGNTI